MVMARFRSRRRWLPKDAVISASPRFPRRANCATPAFAPASICSADFFPEQAREILALEVTPFIFDVSIVAPLNAAAKELGRQNVAGPSEDRHRRDAPRASCPRNSRAPSRNCASPLRSSSKARARCSRTPPIPPAALPIRNCASSMMRSRLSPRPACVPRWCMRPIPPRWCCGPIRISIWCARASRSMDCLRCLRCARKLT